MRTLTAREQQVLAEARSPDEVVSVLPGDLNVDDLERRGYILTWFEPGTWFFIPTPRGLLALRCQAALERGGVHA